MEHLDRNGGEDHVGLGVVARGEIGSRPAWGQSVGMTCQEKYPIVEVEVSVVCAVYICGIIRTNI